MRPCAIAAQKAPNTYSASARRSIHRAAGGFAARKPQQCVFCCTGLAQPVTKSRAQQRWASSPARVASIPSSESPQSALVPETHYDLFPQTLPLGPPPKGAFPIDTRALRKEFLQLQAKAHPDRHSYAMKTRAEATSAHINNAYRTLQDPLTRAQYLLSLRGMNVAEDEAVKVEDPELLMMVLEMRERIEEAQAEEEIEEMRRENEERVGKCETVLEKFFAEDEIEAAKAEAIRLRYWINVRESLNAWEKGKPVILVH